MLSDEKYDIYYDLNGIGYQKYSSPVTLPKGGKIEAYAIDKSGNYKSEVISKEFGISKEKWTIATVSSENSDGPAKSALDADPFTRWVSKESSDNHFITINLGEEVMISGFSYLPCKRGCDGIIYEYEFYTSRDGKKWNKPVSNGEFSNIENNPIEQIIKFDTPVAASFFKLVAKSTLNESKRASAAEIEIFTELNQ
jgi:alpha-L-fucosidase